MIIQALVSTVIGVLFSWFLSSDETQKSVWEFLKKWVGGIFVAVATIAGTFVDLLPKCWEAIQTLVSLLADGVHSVQSFNRGDPFSGGPSFALQAINCVVPIPETMAALLALLTLYLVRVAVKVCKFVLWIVAKIKAIVWPT
jgi:hypothetical protein